MALETLMTNQNTTNVPEENKYEKRLKQLKRLANQCNFKEAKTLADKLVSEGCWKQIICQTCYDTMRRFVLVSPKAALDFARNFKEYDFHYWLPREFWNNEEALNYLNQKRGQ